MSKDDSRARVSIKSQGYNLFLNAVIGLWGNFLKENISFEGIFKKPLLISLAFIF